MRTGKSKIGLFVCSTLMGCATFSVATAGPEGGVITSGQGSITTPNANTTVVNQSSNVLNLNWQSFNVGAPEAVIFQQPSSSAVAINRILDQNPSQIFGRVDANGRVVLLNPNGIVFGRSAQLNVGSLVASSLDLLNYDADGNRFSFSSPGNAGAIVNEGHINANAGSVALLGARVTNDGFIVADYGTVALGAGKAATLDFFGDGLLRLQIDEAGAGAAVSNTGTIAADGGTVLLTAQAAEGVLANVVNNEGIVRAQRIDDTGGVIRLLGPGGTVTSSGTLDASGVGGTGGTVHVLGDRVGLLGSALVDVSGDTGGGTALIGGDFQGKNPDVLNAQRTVVGKDAVINADAGASGDGGRVIVWSDDTTVFRGHISARSQEGDGGFAEVSGKQNLGFTGTVDLSAPNGALGTLLLDPGSISIVAGAGADDGELDDGLILAGDGGAGDFTIGADKIVDELNGANVSLAATDDITFNASVNASGNPMAGNLALTAPTIAFGANNVTLEATSTLSLTSSGQITGTGTLTANVINFVGTGDVGASGAALNTATPSVVFVKPGGDIFLNNTTGLDMAGDVGGSLNVTAGGEITASANPLVVTGTTTLAAGAGNDIVLLNTGNDFSTVAITSAQNVSLRDVNAIDLAASTVSGTLTVNAAGGITHSGALAVTGLTTLDAGTNPITLHIAGNDFSTLAITAASNVSITDTNAIELGASTISGTLTVNAGGAITDSGNLSVTGTTTLAPGAGNSVTLDEAGNNFGGAVSILNGTNATLLDANALNLGGINITGDLVATATAGTITNSGALIIGGNSTFTANQALASIFVNNGGNNFTGTVQFSGAGGLGSISVADTSALDLSALTAMNLSVTAAGITDSGDLVITSFADLNAGAGGITLDSAGNDFVTLDITSGNDVSVTDTNGIALGTSTVSGALTINANGDITDVGGLVVNGTATFNAGVGNNITLDSASNNFSTLAIASGNNVSITDANGIDLGTSTISGTLAVTASGAVTNSGNVVVSGSATVGAGAGNDITLDSAGNNFSTLAITSGNNVSVTDQDGIVLGASTILGALTVNAAGNITDSGDLSVSGATTLTPGAGNSVTLDSAGNDFGGAVSITNGLDATLVDANALNLGTINITGALTATATAGDITNSGPLSIPGATTLTANGAGASILVDNAGNTFTGPVQFNGANLANVSVVDTTALELIVQPLSGNLSVTAAGITQAPGPGLIVGGTTTLTPGAGNSVILNLDNSFGGAVSVTNGLDATLFNDITLNLGAINITGNLVAGADAGGIISSGPLTIGGNSSFSAFGAGDSIVVDNAGNDFTGGVQLLGPGLGTVSVADSSALELAGVSATNLNVTAPGITDIANVTVSGVTVLNAGAGNITLDEPTNNFGTLSIVSGNNVAVTDANGIDLGASTVSGTLAVTANGAVTDSGDVVVAGVTTIDAGPTSDITLDGLANNFGTLSIVSGNNVAVTDANGIDLGASTISGTLAVTANGAVTNSGDIVVAGSATVGAGAANDITLDSAGNNFASLGISSGNDVTLSDVSDFIFNASNVSGDLTLTAGGNVDAFGGLQVAGTTTLTPGAAGNVMLMSANLFGGPVNITQGNAAALLTPGDINLGTISVADTFDVFASGDITSSGALTIGGNTIFSIGGGSIDVTDPGNVFGGTVTFAGASNVSVLDTTSLILQGLTLTGNLNVTAAGIAQTGPLFIGGTTTLAAGTGNDITLNDANDFGTVLVTSADNVSLNDLDGLNLGASTVSGNLSITAAGAVTDSGPLTVAGTTSVTPGNANDVTLDAANDFGTVSIFSAANVTLNDTNALDLGFSNVSGTLAVTANGAVTDSGNILVLGAATIGAGAGNNITLDSANNDFATTLAITSGNNVAIRDVSSFSFGASNVSGNLSVNAGGDITQADAISVAGATVLTPGAAFDVTLNEANTFGGAVSITQGFRASLSNLGDLFLGTIDVDDDLTAIASGNISGGGPLTIGGDAAFSAGGAGASITLVNAGNDFGGTVTFGGATLANVSVVDTTALDLSALTISGNLAATAAGLTQSGALSVGGTTTLDAGGADVLLANAANNFTGTVSVANGQNVTLFDASGLDLGDLDASTLSARALTGDITSSGAITTTGAALFTADGAGSSITVDNAGNSFGGTVTFAGNLANVSVLDTTALDLGAMTLTGDLTVVAQGITGAGPVTVGGLTTLSALGNDITFDAAGTDFGTVHILSAANTSITDANALDLGLVSTGTLTVNAAGDITDSGTVTVTGATSLAPGAAANVTLDSAGNDFGGSVSVANATNVTLVNSGALQLGAVSASGNVSATALTGSITAPGRLLVGGTSTFTADEAGSSITLNNVDNDFGGAVTFAGAGGFANIEVVDASALDLHALTLTGNLRVNAAAITDSGALVVAGTTTLNSNAGDVTLDSAANDFNSVVVTGGANVTLADSTGITLGAINATGNTSITAGGAIASAGGGARVGGNTVTLTGTSIGAAGAALGTDAATLNATTSGGGGIFIDELNAVTLGTLDAGVGAVNLLAAGAISDGTTGTAITAGALAIQGASIGSNANFVDVAVDTLDAASTGGGIFIRNSRALTLTAQATGGAVDITTTSGAMTVNDLNGSSTTLNSAGDLTIGNVSAGTGAANITAGGAITDTGGLLSAGALTISGASIGASDNPINTAVTSVTANAAGGVFIHDANDLTVNSATSSGGAVHLYAGSATDIGSLQIGTINANENVLLVASRDILALPGGGQISTPVVELRAGVIAEPNNAPTGRIGEAARPLVFDNTLTEATVFLPARSAAQPEDPSILPFMNGPAAVEPQFFTFVGSGNPALFTLGTGNVPTNGLLGSTRPFTNIGAFEFGNRAQSGAEEILIIDWASFDPNISLFGTLNPAIRLPPDQLEEDEAAFNLNDEPVEYTVVHTADGWKIVRAFRRVTWVQPPTRTY